MTLNVISNATCAAFYSESIHGKMLRCICVDLDKNAVAFVFILHAICFAQTSELKRIACIYLCMYLIDLY
jgi:hypothetical protein